MRIRLRGMIVASKGLGQKCPGERGRGFISVFRLWGRNQEGHTTLTHAFRTPFRGRRIYVYNRLSLMKNLLKTCNQDRELLNIIKIGNQEPEL